MPGLEPRWRLVCGRLGTLTYLLVGLDKDYTASRPAISWEAYYAQRILDHFAPAQS